MTPPNQPKDDIIKAVSGAENAGSSAIDDGEGMVQQALSILQMSEEGQKLATMVEEDDFTISVTPMPEETTYLPETKKVFIGIRAASPPNPARFALLLAGGLKEAEQELRGERHPELSAPMQEHMKISLAKQADKVASLCVIAYELQELEAFTEYDFLDELRNLGHHEALDIFLQNL